MCLTQFGSKVKAALKWHVAPRFGRPASGSVLIACGEGGRLLYLAFLYLRWFLWAIGAFLFGEKVTALMNEDRP